MCLQNGFPTTFGNVGKELEKIPKCPKSVDFEQKRGLLAHGFEDSGFEQVPEIVPNSLERLLSACKWISIYFWEFW